MQSRSKDITVVIPAYNRAALIGRTLESVARQSMAPAEVILVDNGSDDGTLELMRRWAEGRQGVRVVSESRRGACAARNAGLRLVSTRYVMFFDSDDEMLPGHVADFQHAVERHPEAAVIGRSIVNVSASGRRRRYYFSSRWPVFSHIFRSTMSTQRFIALSSLVRDAGGWDESLSGWDDYELGLRLLLEGGRVRDLGGEPSVVSYEHGDSITGFSYASHPERWEPSLALMRRMVMERGKYTPRQRRRMLRWISAREAILAAAYSREGARELAEACLARAKAHGARRRVHAIYTHNRLFGRLTWPLAAILMYF